MILCYHAVNPRWRDYLSVSPARFAEQCGWLSRSVVRPVGDLVAAPRRSLRSGPFALTFDDGFEDVYTHAFPILRSLGLPATVYLVAGTLTDGLAVDWVDRPPDDLDLTTLTLDQVLEMQDAGIEFASHTWSHPDLTVLDDRDLDLELGRSREALEELLGRPVTSVAYPRGRHSERVRRAAERAGYRFALSLPWGREPVGTFAVPRVGVAGQDGRATFLVKSNPAYLRLRMSPAEGAVAASVGVARRLGGALGGS